MEVWLRHPLHPTVNKPQGALVFALGSRVAFVHSGFESNDNALVETIKSLALPVTHRLLLRIP